MDADIRQLDAVFHVYCALCAVFKIFQVVFSGGKDDNSMGTFVRYLLLLVFHSFRLRVCAKKAAAMSGLLRWETAFLLADEGFHLVRAAHDLGMVMDACVHGIPTMAAMVRVLASLVLLVFHALFLGPRSSLASDAAIFFGDMQFHFFHMLLGTWELLHYLWMAPKRELRTYVCRWTSFLFHTAIVWFYTGGIQVSIRMQFVGAPANPPRPPPMPPVPNPEAVVLAIAAARAAEAAAARAASQNDSGAHTRRDSRSTPQGAPLSHLSRLTGSPRDVDRELGSAGRPCSSRRDSAQGFESLEGSGSQRSPTDLPATAAAAARNQGPPNPENSDARTVLGSVTQTLSGSSPDSSTTALVPYVERTQRVESTLRSELRSEGQAAWDASSDAAVSSVRAAGLPTAASTSERAANGVRSNIATGSAAEMTMGGSSELVLDLAESSIRSPALVPRVAAAPAATQDSTAGATSGFASEKPGPSREPSAKPSPRTSRKPSSATPSKSPK